MYSIRKVQKAKTGSFFTIMKMVSLLQDYLVYKLRNVKHVLLLCCWRCLVKTISFSLPKCMCEFFFSIFHCTRCPCIGAACVLRWPQEAKLRISGVCYLNNPRVHGGTVGLVRVARARKSICFFFSFFSLFSPSFFAFFIA